MSRHGVRNSRSTIALTVGADASMQPWLSSQASSYTAMHHTVGGWCIEVTVSTVDAGHALQTPDVDA